MINISNFRKTKWPCNIDFIAGVYSYAIIILYLLFIIISDIIQIFGHGVNEDGTISINTNLFLFMQFFWSPVVSQFVLSVFSESLRQPVREYLSQFNLSIFDIIIKRFFILVILSLCAYLPALFIIIERINNTLINNSLPPFSIGYIFLQCSLATMFYMSLSFFLESIFSDRNVPLVLLAIYMALEAGNLRSILKEYCIFNGSFSYINYYVILHKNNIVMIILTIINLLFVCASYRRSIFGAIRIHRKGTRSADVG